MIADNPASDHDSHHPPQAKVSLTMIVRDEEQTLPLCLESVRGLFDEIIVVDTGSKDRTKEIALGFGARVIDFAWIDDFAAARNVSLANATGDYVLWLDADDVIEPKQKDKLAKLLKSLRTDKREAYVLRCVCDTEDSSGQIAVDLPRLFPRLDNIRWIYHIHEQIIPALHHAQIPIIWTDIVVRHTGYANAVVHEQKRQRNFRLLCKGLAERPNDPFIYYYLGTLAFEREQWQEALGHFIVSLAKWGTTESIACKLFAMIAWTNQILERYDESLRVSEEGLFYFPNDGELWFRKAVAQRYRKNTGEAEACWTRILSLERPKNFYNVDPGIYGHLTRRNLALIAAERGDYALAEAHWQAVLTECPGDTNALQYLNKPAALLENAVALHQAGNLNDAEILYQNLLKADPENANALAMLGTIQLQRGNSQESIRLLERAITLNPYHIKAYMNLGFALSDLKRYQEALASYDKAIAIDSNCADANLNKGLLKLLLEDYEEGWKLYECRKKANMGIGLAQMPDQPLWLGKESLAGKTILLYTEQGLGDAIQFCRYVPMVEALGAKVILTVPSSLIGLMSTLKGEHLLLGHGTYTLTLDFHCPLLSLPLAFGTTTATIPKKIPYLFVNQENLKVWQGRLGAKSKPRIGLVWSGSETNANDHSRSIPLNVLVQLLKHDFEFHSLQKEVRPDDAVVLANSEIISHANNLTDFADTAALIAEMDLIISVDTSVAHLTGALGKPLWILLPFAPDFRWLTERQDSPWYPTARLFRQTSFGDWKSVIANAKKELESVRL